MLSKSHILRLFSLQAPLHGQICKIIHDAAERRPCHRPSHVMAIISHGMPMEVDKFRLGSTPPSCHNRCHQCSPCTAVQVPTLPAPRKAHPSSRGDPSAYGSQYSNYKPLGWKCCCGDRLYNP